MNSTLHKFDKNAIRRAFAHSAMHYDNVAILQRKIGKKLLTKLPTLQQSVHRILDLGCGTGRSCSNLKLYAPKTSIIALDFAYPMLLEARRYNTEIKYVCADAELLPFKDQSIDLIYSNAMLQWCQDLKATFSDLQRILSSSGLLAFTTFGPATLNELQTSWTQVDNYSHISTFSSLHDLQLWLKTAGFTKVMLESESHTLTYASVRELMQELKALGAHNANQNRARGLSGKWRFAKMIQAYERFRISSGLPATFEIFYGLSWKDTDSV